MRPTVVVHNTVSIDGSVTGFEVDVPLHYQIAAALGADAQLIGSGTALAGIEMFYEEMPPETEQDRHPREFSADDDRPTWIVVDSTGLLAGKLHVFRGSEFCGPLRVLVSAASPASYTDYLTERGYRFLRIGDERVDLGAALAVLGDEYGVRKVMVDSGPTLVAALLQQDLVDELSLVVAPAAAGAEGANLFGQLPESQDLELRSCHNLDGNALHVTYGIGRDSA